MCFFLGFFFYKDFISQLLQTLSGSEDNINAEFHLNVLAGQQRDKKGTAPSLSRKGLNVGKMVVCSVKMTQNAYKTPCSWFNMLADLLAM